MGKVGGAVAAEDVFQVMVNDGVKPSRNTVSMLMQSHLDENNPSAAISLAQGVWNQHGVRPGNRTVDFVGTVCGAQLRMNE